MQTARDEVSRLRQEQLIAGVERSLQGRRVVRLAVAFCAELSNGPDGRGPITGYLGEGIRAATSGNNRPRSCILPDNSRPSTMAVPHAQNPMRVSPCGLAGSAFRTTSRFPRETTFCNASEVPELWIAAPPAMFSKDESTSVTAPPWVVIGAVSLNCKSSRLKFHT